jgi:hypothetical protein
MTDREHATADQAANPPAAAPDPALSPTDAEIAAMLAAANAVGVARQALLGALAVPDDAPPEAPPSLRQFVGAYRQMMGAEDELFFAIEANPVEQHVIRLAGVVRDLRTRLAAK